MKILLIDISGILHSNFHAVQYNKKLTTNTDHFCEERVQQWKYSIFNSILFLMRTHKPHEVVICIDHPVTWRKKIFRYYKAKRRADRKKSKYDYNIFFSYVDEFLIDIGSNFPYKMLKLKYCEADDLIGILAKFLNDDIVIASNDKDMAQLIKSNVRLWNIKEKEFVTCSDTDDYLLRHILMGDSSDGIPNVKSDSDTFITDGKRQKQCGVVAVNKMLEYGLEDWLKENDLEKNYKRNKTLIELSENVIPGVIWNKVIEKYNAIEDKKNDYLKALQYIRGNGFRIGENNIEKFLLQKQKKKSILETLDI